MDDSVKKLPRWKIMFVLSELLELRKSEEDVCVDAQQHNSDALKSSGSTEKVNPVCPMSRVLELACSCTRTQRWTTVAKLFPAVARHISACPLLVWKLGASCLANHPASNKNVMSSFSSAMIQASRFVSPEVLLDHVIYLMCNGEYEEAKRFVESYKKKCPRSHSDTLWAIFQGTRGLLEYISWHTAIRLQDNVEEDALGSLELMTDAAIIVNHAEKAINYFKNSLCCQGNFDIFVLKLTEVLVYYNRLEEADQALTSYLQLNHRHPTPYVFMFNFIQKHYPGDVLRQIYILKELAKVCPCDEHVFKLCKLLPAEEIEFKIQLLFDYVDYDEWRNSVDVWKTLVESLMCQHVNSRAHMLTIRRYIDERSPWWLPYHFRLDDLQFDDPKTRELMVYKSVMVTIMFHSGHSYVRAISEKLGEMDDEDNAGRLNDMLVRARQVGEAVKAAANQEVEIIQQSHVKKVYLTYSKQQQPHLIKTQPQPICPPPSQHEQQPPKQPQKQPQQMMTRPQQLIQHLRMQPQQIQQLKQQIEQRMKQNQPQQQVKMKVKSLPAANITILPIPSSAVIRKVSTVPQTQVPHYAMLRKLLDMEGREAKRPTAGAPMSPPPPPQKPLQLTAKLSTSVVVEGVQNKRMPVKFFGMKAKQPAVTPPKVSSSNDDVLIIPTYTPKHLVEKVASASGTAKTTTTTPRKRVVKQEKTLHSEALKKVKLIKEEEAVEKPFVQLKPLRVALTRLTESDILKYQIKKEVGADNHSNLIECIDID